MNRPSYVETPSVCPTCDAPTMLHIGGLDLVENSGDETLASRTHRYLRPRNAIVWRLMDSAPKAGEYIYAWSPFWLRPQMIRWHGKREHWVSINGARVKPTLWMPIPIPTKADEEAAR